MHNRVAFAVIPLLAALLTQAAVAQTGTADRDEIRDPEIMLPAQQESGRPCVIDAAAVQDPRVNRDVLRVMQTNPYFASSSPQRIARYVTVEKSRSSTWSVEYRYRPVGCGFYVEDRTYTYRSSDGGYVSVDVGTAMNGPGGELFSESKDTTRSRYSGLKIKTDWSQLTSLQAFGNRTPIAVGNRYGTSEEKTDKFGYGHTYSLECQITERRSASEFHPRLTGNAFIETCKTDWFWKRDRKREVSTSTSVTFPDADRVPGFDPNKCRLEWRSASEFHPRWTGDAFVTRCISGESSSVLFPDRGFSFDPDKCRLELRGASEFNRNLHGEA